MLGSIGFWGTEVPTTSNRDIIGYDIIPNAKYFREHNIIIHIRSGERFDGYFYLSPFTHCPRYSNCAIENQPTKFDSDCLLLVPLVSGLPLPEMLDFPVSSFSTLGN